MLRDLLLRWRALFRRSAVRGEIDEELRFHLERQIEAYQRAGLSVTRGPPCPREFGGLSQVKEDFRRPRHAGVR